MCRSIKPLRKIEGGPSEQEIREAALQFVRKVSGYHRPSRANQEVFDAAVADVALATKRLLENLQTPVHVPIKLQEYAQRTELLPKRG